MPDVANAQVDDFERFAVGLIDQAAKRLDDIDRQRVQLDQSQAQIQRALKPIQRALAAYRRAKRSPAASRGAGATSRPATTTQPPPSASGSICARLVELVDEDPYGVLTTSRALSMLEVTGVIARGDHHSVYSALSALVRSGRLERIAPGRYRVPPAATPTATPTEGAV